MNNNFIPIVKSALDGDNLAFEALYNMTKDMAYFVALNITQNQQDAEDILHNSYIKAFQSLSTLNKPETFDNWFNKIVSNNAKDYIKKKKPVLFANTEDFEGEWVEEESNADYIPHQSVDNEEKSRLIMEIINRLPEDQRLCILMYYYQDMTVAEIASTLDLTVSNVKYKLSAARNNIKKDIEALEKNGTKLYAAFPFALISTVLNTEAQNLAARGTAPMYASVLSNFNAATAVSSVAVPTAKSGFFSSVVGKVSVAVLAALLVGGTVLGVTLASQNQQSVPTQNSQTSSTSSNVDTSKSEPSETSTSLSEPEQPEDSTLWLDWKFKDVEKPEFEKTEFVTTELSQYGFSVTTATPSFLIDFDAVREQLKSNKILSDKYKFAVGQNEVAHDKNFSDVGMAHTCTLSDIVYCYTDELLQESDDKYISSPPFKLEAKQSFANYNAPDVYQVEFYDAGLTQDEVYSVMKDIFGEAVAEYLVYSTGTEIDEDRELLSVEIEAPDKNSKYKLTRIIQKNYSGDYDITFQMLFTSNTENRSEDNEFEYYSNNYEPIVLPLTLDEIFPNDMGSTSIDNPKDFFNKAFDFNYNSYDAYDYTEFSPIDDASVLYIVYEDKSVYCDWEVNGYRNAPSKSGDNREIFEFELSAYKQADGTIQVNKLDAMLPSVYAEEGTVTKDKLIPLYVEQFVYMFGADENEIREVVKSEIASEVSIHLANGTQKIALSFSSNMNRFYIDLV